jgi:hypothetical protein
MDMVVVGINAGWEVGEVQARGFEERDHVMTSATLNLRFVSFFLQLCFYIFILF